jgi:hypothetical protein
MIFSFESILLITACLVVLVGVQVRWQAIARQRRARHGQSGADLDRLSASDPTTPAVTATRFS